MGGINFDSVIIADFDESLKSVATSLLYTDVTSKRIHYICLNQWFDKSLLKEENIQPIYFPSINKKNYDDFNNNYFKIYNECCPWHANSHPHAPTPSQGPPVSGVQ